MKRFILLEFLLVFVCGINAMHSLTLYHDSLSSIGIVPVGENWAIQIPAADSLKYQFRFDDSVLGPHQNGVNNEWNGSIIDKGDHRARSFTMSAWVQASSLYGQIMGHGQAPFYDAFGSFGVAFGSEGQLVLRGRVWKSGPLCDGFREITTQATMQIGEWAFLSVVVDDIQKIITLYKNAIPLVTVRLTVDAAGFEGHGIGLLSDESVFFVGNSERFTGAVDEVQVWGKALSTEEVKASMMADYRPQVPDDLLAYYIVDDNTTGELKNWGKGGDVKAGLYRGSVHYEPSLYAEIYSCSLADSLSIIKGHEPDIVQPESNPDSNFVSLTYFNEVLGGSIDIFDEEGMFVGSGTLLKKGTIVDVVLHPFTGYRVKTFTANGVSRLSELNNNSCVLVVDADMHIQVAFEEMPEEVALSYEIINPEGGSALVYNYNGINVPSNSRHLVNTTIYIYFFAKEGYDYMVTRNGVDITSEIDPNLDAARILVNEELHLEIKFIKQSNGVLLPFNSESKYDSYSNELRVSDDTQVQIYTLSGGLVLSGYGCQSLQSLSPGIYLARIRSKGVSQVVKVVR